MLEETIIDPESVLVTSFEAFYTQTWSKVYRAVTVTIREPDLAKEAADEAMTRAYERWRSVSQMSNPEGWVYRVAVNWARSRLRRRSLWRKLVPSTYVFQDPEVADPAIVDAVARLPVRHRDVVVMRFLLDMSEEEMSKTLGVPKGTVKSRLSRALATLKGELS